MHTPAPEGFCSQRHARSRSQVGLSGYAEQFTTAVGGMDVGGIRVGGIRVGGMSVNVEVAVGDEVSVGVLVRVDEGV